MSTMSDADDFRRQVFIEWLCTPKREREPREQAAFAEQHGVSNTTLARWKRDREFMLAWESHYLATIGSPERKQNLLDTLYRTGQDGDDPRHVQAAKTYMELVDGLKPQKVEVTLHRPAKDLTDEELNALGSMFAERERLARERDKEAS